MIASTNCSLASNAGWIGQSGIINIHVYSCYSTGNISSNNCGGILGSNSCGSVINCYSTGNINGINSGGIIGGNSTGSVVNCFTTGNINGNNSGGICSNDSTININYAATFNTANTETIQPVLFCRSIQKVLIHWYVVKFTA